MMKYINYIETLLHVSCTPHSKANQSWINQFRSTNISYSLQYHLHFEYCSQMQFPHPQFLIDSQLTNMSSQEVTVQKISCPPKSSEDWIINKHQFCNYCKFDSRYVEKMHNNCASFDSTSTLEDTAQSSYNQVIHLYPLHVFFRLRE